MDFRLSDETLEWKDHCRKFAREVIRPVAAAARPRGERPVGGDPRGLRVGPRRLRLASALQDDPEGLKGVIYAEELHWGCAGIALAISASSLCAAGIASSGTPEQIARWIPEVVGSEGAAEARRLRGDRAAGRLRRQVASHDREARRRRLDPERHQDLHLERRHRRRDGRGRDRRPDARPPRPGVVRRHQGQPRPDGSARRSRSSASAPRRPPRSCSRTAASRATPCSAARRSSRRSSSALARASARGPSGALATFEITRPTVGASALGIAQAAYEWTLEYLAGRTENGKPLLEQQRIQQVIADVATEIEAARLLVWRAAWMGRNGVPMTGGQGSMSKLKGGDVAMWATTTLMDLVGPEAQSMDCPLEKWFRDAKIYQIFEGTAQIQRLVIARMQAAEYAERLQFAQRGRRRTATAQVHRAGAGRDDPVAAERQAGPARRRTPTLAGPSL